jgi:uncharacterized membrane protein
MDGIRQRQSGPPVSDRRIAVAELSLASPTLRILRRIRWLGGSGLLVSAYLVREHYEAAHASMCDITRFLSCSRVNQSEYAILFGVPVAVWGLLWNGTVVTVAFQADTLIRRDILKEDGLLKSLLLFLFSWSVMGALSVVYFITAEFLLHAMCIFCTLTHILIVAILYHARRLHKAARIPLTPYEHASRLRWWLIGLAAIAASTIVAFWLPAHLPSFTTKPAPRVAGVSSVSKDTPAAFLGANTTSASFGTNVTSISFLTNATPSSSRSSNDTAAPSRVRNATTPGIARPLRTPAAPVVTAADLARCLTTKGYVMFGSLSCGHCVMQKNMFGPAFRYVAFVDCWVGTGTQKCKANKITGFPTWVRFVGRNETSRHSGSLPLSGLAAMANCSAPTT